MFCAYVPCLSAFVILNWDLQGKLGVFGNFCESGF